MISISKNQISTTTAQSIIAHQMGCAQRISSINELKDGFFNVAYHVILEDGFQCVLKIAPPPEIKVLRYERNIMQTEVKTIQLVKSLTTMPVPEIFFYDDSCSLITSPYYCMQFIDGIPLDKYRKAIGIAEQTEIDQTLGHLLHEVNNISGDRFGLYAYPELPGTSWAETFYKLLENIIQDGQDACIDLPISPVELTEIISKYNSYLAEIVKPVLVHWDLWDGNIFIDPKTNKIIGIIDFERSLWADPLMEVNFGAFGINQNFLNGYGKCYPFSQSENFRRSLYNIYLYLIMFIEPTYRHYPNKDQETWARHKLIEEFSKLR